MRRGVLAVLLACLAGVSHAQMQLHSAAFDNFAEIPHAFVCDEVERDGFRPSIPLDWSRVPARVQSFVLLMDDMNSTGIVHWLVRDIPRQTSSIELDATETNMPAGSIEMPNSFGVDSYSAPCPESGVHFFRFRLFALDKKHSKIEYPDPLSMVAEDIVTQLEKDILYTAVLVGKVDFGVSPSPSPSPPPHWRPSPPVFSWGNATAGNGSAINLIHLPAQIKLINLETVNSTDSSGYPTISARSRRHAKRPVQPTESVAQFRFVKPSEVMHADNEKTEGFSCDDVHPAEREECIINLQQGQSIKDQWTCKGARVHAGIHFTESGDVERCGLQVRMGRVECADSHFPKQFTCRPEEGETMSIPQILWRGAPEDTQSYVVMVEEGGSHPNQTGNIHWLVSNIPSTANMLNISPTKDVESQLPPLSVQLRNSFGVTGFTPPCPDDNSEHTFRIRLFAMPHPSSTSVISQRFTSMQVTEHLQKFALCMASFDLILAFEP